MSRNVTDLLRDDNFEHTIQLNDPFGTVDFDPCAHTVTALGTDMGATITIFNKVIVKTCLVDMLSQGACREKDVT